MLQWVLTGAMVTGCAAYAGWSLGPAALRAWLIGRALRTPLPGPIERRLRAAMPRSGGCACDGCGRAAKPPEVQKITLHRRR